jgi:hypothetical protein
MIDAALILLMPFRPRSVEPVSAAPDDYHTESRVSLTIPRATPRTIRTRTGRS